MLLKKWKPESEDSGIDSHSYSLVSDYYLCKRIKGLLHYKITAKGLWKLKEGRLCKDTHNFMVYLAGKGDKKLTNNEYENGKVRV